MPDHIDATNSEPLEEADIDVNQSQAPQDPALAVTVALANELQHVYANDQQKLQDMNRSLRSAIRGTKKD